MAAASRRLAAEGLTPGTAGNVSERAGDRVAVTPSGAALAELGASQIVVVDLDGGVHEGRLEPTSELPLHLELYRRCGAGAVVHTHSPFAAALSCVLEGELPCVHYHLLMLAGSVPIVPYETFGTFELARATADALGESRAALLANHGAVAIGGNLDDAVELALVLEWSCEVYWRAAALGNPRELTADERAAVLARFYENS